MIRIFLPLVCAALGLAPSADATASTPPASQSIPGSAAPATPEASTGTPAGARVSTLIGMPVVSVDGSPLGKVKDIIFDPRGRATHVIVAYASGPGPEEIPEGKQKLEADGRLVAVPWDTAAARINDGKLVLDGTKLQSAPSFAASEWPNLQDPSWSATADAYWHIVAPTPMSAHRNAQIDPTARLRARPTRDGD